MRWTMILLILLWPGLILASPSVSERVDQHSPLLTRVSDQLWDWAELGYLEEKSSLEPLGRLFRFCGGPLPLVAQEPHGQTL